MRPYLSFLRADRVRDLNNNVTVRMKSLFMFYVGVLSVFQILARYVFQSLTFMSLIEKTYLTPIQVLLDFLMTLL